MFRFLDDAIHLMLGLILLVLMLAILGLCSVAAVAIIGAML